MEQSLEADMHINYITSPPHTIPMMQYNDLGLETERKIDEVKFKMQINEYCHIRIWWVIAMDLLPPITPTWYCSRLTPSIHPYAVSPDLVNLWLDSMFISPLELSWEIRWCTTATQSVIELSRKVQVTQILEDVLIRPYSTSGDCCGALSVYSL